MRPRIVASVVTLVIGVLTGGLAAAPQQPKIFRVGVVSLTGLPPHLDAALLEGLREHGWVEGQTILIERRSAEGRPERLPALAAELVRLRVDVIIASGASAVRAAQKATAAIPIVIAGAPDPVAFGLIASLAHPGANVTGLSDSAGREIEGKRLGLLKEAVPGISRVAFVLDSASRVDPAPVEAAARTLGLALLISTEAGSPEEFQAAFATLAREGADAVYAPETPVNARHRRLLVGLAARYRLPAMYGSREFVEAGGLMAYGPSFADLWRRAAAYVDKILTIPTLLKALGHPVEVKIGPAEYDSLFVIVPKSEGPPLVFASAILSPVRSANG